MANPPPSSFSEVIAKSVDHFQEQFETYIDSGFHALDPTVASLTSTLIVIDITIAGLIWAWGSDHSVIGNLVRKTIQIGVFAYIVKNFNYLANVVYESFAGLGLIASRSGISTGKLLQPSSVAGVGYDSSAFLLDKSRQLCNGLRSCWNNFPEWVILGAAWVLIVACFFILAVQIFVAIIEFKLASLVGFALIPFAFWKKTSFIADKVFPLIVNSGVKILALALITGLGVKLFKETEIPTTDPVVHALAVLLAAVLLVGLSLFGTRFAAGIVSSTPALDAGTAKQAATQSVSIPGSAAGVAGKPVAMFGRAFLSSPGGKPFRAASAAARYIMSGRR